MLVLVIALLCGTLVMALCRRIFHYIVQLQLEKKIKERIDGARIIHQKGISGSMVFISGKIGNTFVKLQNKHINRLLERIEKALSILGEPYTIPPSTFLGIQILAGLFLIPFFSYLFNSFDVFLMTISFFSGFLLPYLFIKSKVKEKHKRIFRQIPDVLDLLTLMMEAGLDFNTAINRIVNSDKGPLINEFSVVQKEIRLGKSRSDAYTDMTKRLEFLPLTNVVNSFLLAFKTGSSLAPTLKALSEQFRVERMQLAEKAANEAPVKLLLPLVILIFPTIFIILFGPILLSFLGGGF